ncbi:MAG TPA: hypothetical protein VKR06_19610 [Ktedonosporobacter sp.]|nr:hypothetical protein [Ktedonosporobacter sp.]
MAEIHTPFINYYEYLNIAQDAPTGELQRAFEALVNSTRKQLNNSLTMQSARYIDNVIVPGIREQLLASSQARALYNEQLLAARQKQAARSTLANNEGLDDVLPRPFFFDELGGYDTETPAMTLREIAHKLDSEWAQAIAWITNTADRIHVFVGFLTYIANRPQLAEEISKIIKATQQGSMPANEGIEHCINILDPQIERPMASIWSPEFDGKVFEAGEFIPDLPAKTELILGHSGTRGCVFGVVESRSSLVRFVGEQSQVRFVLMPEGTDPAICASEVRIPLLLQVQSVQRNSDYTADLVVRMENQASPSEIPLKLHLYVLPLPPRVSFKPMATQEQPLWIRPARQGEVVSAVITPQNGGDEKLVPLRGRISTSEQGASASPERFQANEPITLTVDTRNRPYGKVFDVIFNIEYGTSSRASGPTALYLRSEILPTPWQSLLRQRNFSERLITGFVSGLAGSILGVIVGGWLVGHTGLWFLGLLAVPAFFIWLTRLMAQTLTAHVQRSGKTEASLKQVRPGVLWGVPIVIALIVTLTCALIPDGGLALLFSACSYFVVGLLLGFILDQAHKPAKPS